MLMLGHAAEHLAHSRAYSTNKADRAANAEAIHILTALSREIFDEYAERRTPNRRVENWVTERAVRLFE